MHALTDVTGFGLAGHAPEMARGARCDIEIDWRAVPVLPGARELMARGFVTGASHRNWAGYGGEVVLPPGFDADERALLTDPQTSGGLLVSCSAAAVGPVQAVFALHGFEAADVIGSVATRTGLPRLRMR